ncbi:hypothetical protein TVAG_464460 [Trichomonas vaginalis G3]|uniref:Uncharacterized protein n=1 Tax=Trichomonas vaginalis (strain ATCC PRA-98 / G3) TaxID=412133 RepID=A2EEJ1_TRIV3|nr:hypothetical protein TVAG_464460 [Trichomonas vaginalis G3]|eukprot:XP_001321121.1 hypothetical protein [Trichomonas vaginalis G3]
MTEDETRIFNSGLQDIKPLTNIVELHWSRNSFTLETAEQFSRIFLRSPHIKYIGLSGIFNKTNLNVMETIITAISESPIWGLEIEGTEENRLGDKIFDLMKSVKKIHKLKSLDIIGHNFSDSIAVTLLKGIKFMKSLSELSIDKTSLNNKTSVYGFYNNIMVIPFLKSFYPHVYDIKNVMEKDVFVHQHGLHHEKFFGRYVNFSKPTNIYSRMFFYSNSIDMTKVYDYSNKFPIYLFTSPSDDPLYLMSPNVPNCSLLSLWTFPLISKNENLSIVQKNLFISPFSVPHKAPTSHEFVIPHVLHKTMGRHTFLIDQNDKNEKVTKILNNSENFQQNELPNEEQNNNTIKLIKVNNTENVIQNNFNPFYDVEEIQDQINVQHSIFPEDLDRTINSLNYINKICCKISNDRKIDIEEITIENPSPISGTFSVDPELSEMSKKLCKTIYTKSENNNPFLAPLSTTNNDKPFRPDLPSPKPLSPSDNNNPFLAPLSTTNNDKPFRPDLPSPKPLSPNENRSPFFEPLSTTNNDKSFRPDLPSPKPLSPNDNRNPFLDPLSTGITETTNIIGCPKVRLAQRSI